MNNPLAMLLTVVGFFGATVAQEGNVKPPVKVHATQMIARSDSGPRAVLEVELMEDLTDEAKAWLDIDGSRINVDLKDRHAGSKLYISAPLPTYGAECTAELWYSDRTRQVSDRVKYARAHDNWVVHWIPGFHFDPVWWNTQANYVERGEGVDSHMASGHVLMAEYLRKLKEDPSYKVALHQLPYVKTYIEAHPERLDEIRQYIDNGRIDLVGGTYNEYSSTLVSAEAGARNAIYGSLFQRNVLGGAGKTFWQCDVFGHDPSFPSVMSLTGHTDGAFARGPFHQWGAPRDQVNFPSEFLWMAPDGNAILTHYMTGHYGFGYEKLAAGMNRVDNVGMASNMVLAGIFEDLRRPALTHHVMVPMHMDFIRPLENLTDVMNAWNDDYMSPRMEISTPQRFFDGVRAEIGERGLVPRVITRDMNPIFTGCQVSFADLKLANRECESVLREAEMWATIATLEGAAYPSLGLDRAWRQLLFNAHHDGVTGSCGDQVYLDLMVGYRDAHRIATEVRKRALDYLTSKIGVKPGERVLWNSLAHERDALSEGLTARNVKVPALGYRLVVDDHAESRPTTRKENVLENEFLKVTVDLEHGGCLSSILDKRTGKELLTGFGNDVVVLDEYPVLPGYGEGPWHLSPNGKTRPGTGVPARITANAGASDLQQTMTVEAQYDEFVKRQVITLRPGRDQVDLETQIVNWTGRRQLLRVVFPVDTPGARPVFQTAAAVIGRPFARDVDTEKDPWTLDNAAYQWAGLGSVCAAEVVKGNDVVHRIALGVGEILVSKGSGRMAWTTANDIARAFVQLGVTTTITSEEERRYGDLTLDSNTPDFRIVMSETIDRAGWRLEDNGVDVPVLSIGANQWGAVASNLAKSAVVKIDAASARVVNPRVSARNGAAILNAGSVSMHITPGIVGVNLLRANLSWPSGAWIDGEPRRHPDGTPFGAQHGTHVFRYSFVPFSGDYRNAHLTERAAEVNSAMVPTERSERANLDEQRVGNDARSFMTVKPECIQATALKLAGNPEAEWMWRDIKATSEIVLRLWNPTSTEQSVALSAAYDIVAAEECDLLERPIRLLTVDRRGAALEMGPFALTTVKLTLTPKARDAAAPSLEPTEGDCSASQYWLENAGEGVTGNGAVSLTLGPAFASGGAEFETSLRIVNRWRNKSVKGVIEVSTPKGFVSSFDKHTIDIAAGQASVVPLKIACESRQGVPSEKTVLVAHLDDGRSVRTQLRTLESDLSQSSIAPRVLTRERIDNLTAQFNYQCEEHSEIQASRDVIVGGSSWKRGVLTKGTSSDGFHLRMPMVDQPHNGYSWFIARTADRWSVNYSESVLWSDAWSSGVPIMSFGLDQLRLKRNVRNESRVSERSLVPWFPAIGDFTESSACVWRVPSSQWHVDMRPGEVSRRRQGGQLERTWECDIVVGPSPDRGELVVKGPCGSLGAVGFVVVPEQDALSSANDVKVDGDLREWAEREFSVAKGKLGEARAAVRWSGEGLAFAVDVGDEQHFQIETGATLWRGDSVQFAISARPNTNSGYNSKDLELGAALTLTGPVVWCWYGGDGGKTGRLDNAKIAVKRRGAGTLYELFIPRESLRGLELRSGNVLGFSYIANDNDGTGYRGATEWTPGMTGTKDSSLFGDLLLLDPAK